MEQPVCRKDQDFYRLIPSRFPPVDVYERLDSTSLRVAAQELEALTNPRLAAKKRVSAGDHAKENSAQLQNWNHAPFTYKNPRGTYFLSEAHGVLEAAGDKRAALVLAILRRELFLSNTNEEPTSLDMRMLVTRIQGKFIDLTDLSLDTPKAERWKIGQGLLDSGHYGIVYRRVECPKSEFITVFKNELLKPSTQAEHYRFVWDGKIIKSIYDFSSETKIEREELIGPAARAAA